MTDTIDLDAVEKKIQEEYVRALAALQTLRKYLNNGGNGVNGRVSPVTVDSHREKEPSKLELMAIDGEDSSTIIDKVEDVMQADPLKKWSVPSMIDHLKSIGFPLQAKKPEATLGLIFGKLAKKRKTIVRVRKGSGRMPNLFRAIPREHQEDASDSSNQNERAAS